MWKLVGFGRERNVFVIDVVVEDVILHFPRVEKLELTVWALMDDDLILHVLVVARTSCFGYVRKPRYETTLVPDFQGIRLSRSMNC